MPCVLVVDDENGIRKTLKTFLEMEGHEVHLAEDVDQGVVVLQNQPVDVVVSDIVLPQKSGMELLRYAHNYRSEIQVIMISGEPTIQATVEAMRLGAFDFIGKPVSGKDLCKVVAEAARKKARIDSERAALRESEARFQRLTENARDMIWRTDLNGKVEYVNPAVAETLGIAQSEALGMTAEEYLTVESVKTMSKAIRGAIAADPPLDQVRCEVQYLRKDGSLIPCEMNVTLVWNNSGKIVALEGITRDITERKQAEEEMRKGEEKFRLIFENARDAIFWADPKSGLIVNCNPAAERLLEKNRDEIIGNSQTKLHPPEKVEYYSEMFRTHNERNGAMDQEAEVQTKSGKIVPVFISSAVTEINGEPIIQGIFHDISHLKR